MNKLRLSPEAARDLTEIKRYISRELKNPASAQRVVRGITNELRILERHAEAGPAVAALTGYPSDLRILVCQTYCHLQNRRQYRTRRKDH